MSGVGPLTTGTGQSRRDYLAEFIQGSRWLRPEQVKARTAWFDALSTKKKQAHLFEFEMTLKGLICFGSPMNHPGSLRRGKPTKDREFRDELGIVRSILKRVIQVGTELTQGMEGATTNNRYLESVIAEDGTRFQMRQRSILKDAPDQSFAHLVLAIENLLIIVDGLLRTNSISYRRFASVIQSAKREIHRSTYFDPLAAIEFCNEFDEIKPIELYDMVRLLKSDPARKIASLTFLALFRILNYLDTIGSIRNRTKRLSVLFAWLAVLRSDTRALIIFLKRNAASWMSDGFGDQFEGLDATALTNHFQALEGEFRSLKSLRELLGSIGDQLRLEQRKLFDLELDAIDTLKNLDAFSDAVSTAIAPFRAFIQNAIVLLALEFDPMLSGSRMFSDLSPSGLHSERLRRDIWMFQQILRAFIEKAKSSSKFADKWSGKNTFHFVHEFVSYFRSMGYQLLRYSDYERLDNFMSLVDRLREGDVLEVQRLEQVVATCEDFQSFLLQAFDAVDKRSDLADRPFDRKEAVTTLKLVLKR
ncbi:MAG: hypothetical protein QNJ97_03760 [Myxococcota bacterium]|nr:hypothetical protein [Myxococcota bacterium]